VIFGAVWTIMSSEIALTCFAVGLVAALFAAAIALRPTVVARVG